MTDTKELTHLSGKGRTRVRGWKLKMDILNSETRHTFSGEMAIKSTGTNSLRKSCSLSVWCLQVGLAVLCRRYTAAHLSGPELAELQELSPLS